MYYVTNYVCLALGGPGNILSAIVWLRRHVAGKNSSSLYLAVLAINDLVFLLINAVDHLLQVWRRVAEGSWLFDCIATVWLTTTNLEPLLVLGFSVERLIAISRPLQVRCIHVLYTAYTVSQKNVTLFIFVIT